MGCVRRLLVPVTVTALASGAALASVPLTHLLAETESAAAPLAVVADVTGSVRVRPAASEVSEAAQLGRPLRRGDVVEADPGGSAWLFASGVGMVAVPSGGRVSVPADLVPRSPALLSDRSIRGVGNGLRWWGEPSARPSAQQLAARAAGPHLLSPRSERVLRLRPVFFWADGDTPVRVVVSDGERILYHSAPVTGSFLRYPAFAAELRPGGSYHWWIETGGRRLAGPAAFRVAGRDTLAAAAAFEAELAALAAALDRPVLASFLRCAFYADVGAWSRVLEASQQVPMSHSTGEFAFRSTTASRNLLGLDPWSTTYLVALRIWRQRGF